MSSYSTIYRRLALPVWGLLALSVVTIVILIFVATEGQDRNAIQRSEHVMRTVIKSVIREEERLVLETGFWDQAVENLVTDFDPAWAESNIANHIGYNYGISEIYVLAADDEPILTAVDGEGVENTDPYKKFGSALRQLVANARQGGVRDDPVPASGFVKHGDLLYLASVVVMTDYYDLDGEEVNEQTGAVLIVLRLFEPDFLQKLGDHFNLPNLRLGSDRASSTSAHFPITTIEGDVIGQLVWEPILPGREIKTTIILGIAVIFIVLAAITYVLMARLGGYARRIVEESTAHERSSQLLQSILDSVDQGIVAWDENNKLIAWNKRSESFLLPQSEIRAGMTGLEFLACFSEDFRKSEMGKSFAEWLPSAEQFDDGKLFTLPDGRRIRLVSRPVSTGGYTTTYTDMTDRYAYETGLKMALELAQEANRAKSSFIANVSHELRTPLNAIMGFSEVLMRQESKNLIAERRHEYLNFIHDAGETLLYNINQVLDLAKIEAGKLSIELADIDVAELVKATARLIRTQADQQNLDIVIEAPPTPVELRADHMAVHQILTNLLSNAVKFTPKDGLITVSYGKMGDEVFISVRDTGVGIEPEMIERVLEPFEQGKAGIETSQKGTGLGLSIARSLADLHDGRIELESTVGEGSVFTVFLPAV